MFGKLFGRAKSQDNISSNMSNSVRHTKFKANVYILSKEEGGRHTPFFSNYRPKFYFGAVEVSGVVTLPDGIEMVTPGTNVELTVELVTQIAIENGMQFLIREGSRTVGSGNISEIIQ